jgi:hypothetical protein
MSLTLLALELLPPEAVQFAASGLPRRWSFTRAPAWRPREFSTAGTVAQPELEVHRRERIELANRPGVSRRREVSVRSSERPPQAYALQKILRRHGQPQCDGRARMQWSEQTEIGFIACDSRPMGRASESAPPWPGETGTRA